MRQWTIFGNIPKRDNIRIGRKYKEAISSIDGIYRKMLVTCGYPIGYVLAVKKGLNR